MNKQWLFCLLWLSRFGLAGYFNVSEVQDSMANEALFQLISNQTWTVNQQQALMSTGLRALFQSVSPQIKSMPDYTGQFVANCSIFLNLRIEGVACDVTSVSTAMKPSGYDLNSALRLPLEYATQITQSDIILVNLYADWRGKTTAYSEQYTLGPFARMRTCTSTLSVTDSPETPSGLLSSSESLEESQTAAPSVSKPFSLSPNVLVSDSHSMSSTSSGSSASVSLLVSSSASSSGWFSESKSLTEALSLSQSSSIQVSDSRSMSSTSSGSSVSASLWVSSSASSSGWFSESQSLSEALSPSQSFSKILSGTCSPSVWGSCLGNSTGLAYIWSGSAIYSNPTNQASRYTTPASGVVGDSLTGLQWEQAASSSTMTWSAAGTYCAGRTTGGLSGWRLPNVDELQTLVDYTTSSPSINSAAFPSTPSNYFWTSTLYQPNPTSAWLVYFFRGDVGFSDMSNNGFVRCAR
ncbi:MAG: DUF1566 domain-containing protein [Myxococcaceae bacterium]|nr:DUF1566 domain-containing protein [Myxococcaceae bacterium]MBH2005893.1 DUF1566 domain-containing protein [Myxococcaceae bacterium]